MVDNPFTPFKPLPEPGGGRWWQWAVILAMLSLALVPWAIMTWGT
jgi:hypothetical protein